MASVLSALTWLTTSVALFLLWMIGRKETVNRSSWFFALAAVGLVGHLLTAPAWAVVWGDAPLARGRGRGELLQAQPPLHVRDLVVVLPPVQVATGPAYAALARHREAHPVVADASAWPRGGFSGWNDVAERAVNDFEAVVPAAHAPVAASLESLRRAGASPALLSGSGAACFGVFPDEGRARAAAADVASSLGWPALHVRTLAAFPEPEQVVGRTPGG
jgi:4-diphosphocytidyl-2C-methyl-D-erythritol kinase